MKKTLASLSCILIFNLHAQNNEAIKITDKEFSVTLSWLENKPSSYAKDFFILQFLKQKDTSLTDAKIAYSMAKRQKGRLKIVYDKKFNPTLTIKLNCTRFTSTELITKNEDCIVQGLNSNLSKIIDLTNWQKNFVIKKLINHPTLSNDLKIINSKLPFSTLIKTDVKSFYRVIFNIDSNFRKTKFNYPIPQSFVNDISKEKDFNKFVKLVTSNDNLTNLQASLFKVDDNKNITHRTLFLLGINALKHNNKNYALKYFEYAYKKAYFQSDKDKVVFWQYLLNNDKLLLEKLSKSFSINIYSLYAKELLDVPINNIIYDINILNKESNFDTLNHFKWIEVLENTKKNFDEKKLLKYHELFSSEDTLAHYAFILERFHKYKKQYFITPYKHILSKYDIERQVLIYSIAKQESHFIPTVASVATAQGVMQIMPFLSKDIARRINKPYNIYEQFVPKVNLEYSNIHLNSLSKQFNNNPLFMAYAYNGGAGYFKSQLKRNLFTKRGKYEPFMSIESVSYPETRNYGKKVLANYYIYNNHINKDNKIKLSTIFQNLIVPR